MLYYYTSWDVVRMYDKILNNVVYSAVQYNRQETLALKQTADNNCTSRGSLTLNQAFTGQTTSKVMTFQPSMKTVFVAQWSSSPYV